MTHEVAPERAAWQHRLAALLVLVTGLIATGASLPQLVNVWARGNADGVSLLTFLMFYSAQLALAYMGYVKRAWSQMITVGLTALTTTALIVSIIYFRYIAS